MSHRYFRLYPTEEDLEQYQAILRKNQELGLIRSSVDLESEQKSISILCKSKTTQEEIERILKENHLNLLKDKEIESEILEEEKRTEATCSHGHHGHNCNHEHHKHHKNKKHKKHHNHHDNHWLKAIIGITFGVGMLVLSLLSLNIPLIAYCIITGISTLLTLYLGYKVYQSAWNDLRQKKWSMSILYTISTLAIMGISIASIFVPGLAIMLESAALILGLYHLGEAIEHSILGKINTKLDVRDCAPRSVLLRGTDKNISVTKLIPNDVIVLKEGDVIPIDGILMRPALLYTTRIDGNLKPEDFNPGDAVIAGMALAYGMPPLEIRVTKTYQNSRLSLITKNINKDDDEDAPKSDIELFTNKILKYFVPSLLAVAVISGIVIGLLFPPAIAIQCVISVLVSACPCALRLITPTAVKIGMKKAAEHGVEYKNGQTLQNAADVDIVVFDINGTLTKGKISIENLKIDDRKLLGLVALLESKSLHPVTKSIHPIAKVIKDYIEKLNIVIDESLEISDVDTSCHSGVKAKFDDEIFMVGNINMLRDNGIDDINPPYHDDKNGDIYIVRNKRVIGQIDVTDPLRHDAKKTIEQLQKMGKQVHICTGAPLEKASRYAENLGIPKENICADAVGTNDNSGRQSKRDYIQKLQKEGTVLMVGDGCNDLEAMTIKKDVKKKEEKNKNESGTDVVSCAVGGNTYTENAAGMVLQGGALFPIATALDIASKTKKNIFQNLFVSLGYNSTITLVAGGLFVALGFVLNPAIGIALMIVESAIVLLNLYRLKQQKTLSTATQNENHSKQTTTPKMLRTLGAEPTLRATPTFRGLSAESIDPADKPRGVDENVVKLFPPSPLSDQVHEPYRALPGAPIASC